MLHTESYILKTFFYRKAVLPGLAISLFYVLFPLLGFAQNKAKIDSLKKALQTSLVDSTQIKIYNDIAYNYLRRSEYDSTLTYIKKAEDLSLKINYLKGLARVYSLSGIMIEYYGDYPKALALHYKALNLYEKIGYERGISATYNNIGLIHFRNGEYKEALNNYFSDLKIIERNNNDESKVITLANIGEVYLKLRDYDQAIEYEKKSISLNGRKYTTLYGFANGILGLVHHEQKKYQQALNYYKESLIAFQKEEDRFGEAEYLLYVAKTFNELNKPDSALIYLRASTDLSDKINAKEWKKEAYYEIANTLKNQRKYAEALAYYDKANALKDSIFNEESAKRTAQLHALYETEKKEAQITSLTKEKRTQELEIKRQHQLVLIFVSGLGIISVLAGFLVIINRQRKIAFQKLEEKNAEINQQKEEITTQAEDLKRSNIQLENEKNKSEKLLLNILPESIATELKERGEAKPKLYEHATILFADFVNFTTYAQNSTPQEITRKLDSFFLTFDMLCAKNGLEKIKTIGDCYMAAGGLPTPNTTNPLDAVKTALEFIESIEGTGWQIRIGIHTGAVVAGVIGINKFAFDVWGDTVNIAARLESTSDNNRVNISAQTYELIRKQYTCTHRGKIFAKNKGEIDMYFVETKVSS